MSTRHVTLRLDEEIYEELASESDRRKMSLSSVIQEKLGYSLKTDLESRVETLETEVDRLGRLAGGEYQ